MRSLLPPLALLCSVAACDGASPPPDGSVIDDDAGPLQFDVALADADGMPLASGAIVEQEYGCQGGSHIYAHVVATGTGLADAQAELVFLEDDGGAPASIRLRMSPTGTGAELRFAMFVIQEFGADPGSFRERDATLRAIVRRRDGARVIAERRIHLVPGTVCDPTCYYDDYLGTGTITDVTRTGPSSGCELADAGIRFDYFGDDGYAQRELSVSVHLPADCMSALGLEVGASVAINRRLITNGTCTPELWELVTDPADCEALCP